MRGRWMEKSRWSKENVTSQKQHQSKNTVVLNWTEDEWFQKRRSINDGKKEEDEERNHRKMLMMLYSLFHCHRFFPSSNGWNYWCYEVSISHFISYVAWFEVKRSEREKNLIQETDIVGHKKIQVDVQVWRRLLLATVWEVVEYMVWNVFTGGEKIWGRKKEWMHYLKE